MASLDSCRVPDGTHRTGALKEVCDVTCAEGKHGHSLAVQLDVQIISIRVGGMGVGCRKFIP